MNNNNNNDSGHKNINSLSPKSKRLAISTRSRNIEDANKVADKYISNTQAVHTNTKPIFDSANKLKITFLGGLDDIGEKNMAVLEWQNDAIVLDCGMNLSVDLPGVNYEINSPAYLESIKHKLKGYVITHGHLDHVGGLRHVVPKIPAPIFGSLFTNSVIENSFNDEMADNNFKPEFVSVNIDDHQKHKIGVFYVEFIRVTHSLPDPAAICIYTPVGNIIATGDFRLDPEPLDKKHVDTKRLEEIGKQGVLALLSDSTNSELPGRTLTEHTLLNSFHDVIDKASGRIFIALFSSNMNRTQMIINAAVAAGRKVALDGRSMLAYADIAVRQGILSVPKGTIVSMSGISTLPEDQVLVLCTGGQGEDRAALQRMSEGNHKNIKLKKGDTVVISSNPIPGNEVSYDSLSNKLTKLGAKLYRNPTHELDGCGELHVSGHGRRDELKDMILMTKPKFVIPVHAGALRRKYHGELAVKLGWSSTNVLLPNNGDSLWFTKNSVEFGSPIEVGGLLIDQSGSVVDGVVVRDRVMLAQDGILTVILTIDDKKAKLISSPDIISRGYINVRENGKLINGLRDELKRAVAQRYARVDNDRFKQEIKDFVTHYLYENTASVPLVIPVINIINQKPTPMVETKQIIDNENYLEKEQKRFKEMRAKLLGQDDRS